MITMRTTISLFVLSISIQLQAQLLNVAGTEITIVNGTQVQVNGDVITSGNAMIANDGILYITGDIDHDAAGTCFGTSLGEVVLVGADQSIDGTSLPVFNDLTLAGTGTKHLQRDVQVGGNYLGPQGVLRLNDRQLQLNGHTLTILNGNNDAIQRTSGFIVSETDPLTGYGRLRWNIGQQAAAGNVFTFPFGNAATNNYLPFVATITDPGSGLTGWLSMATYPTDPTQVPNNRPLPIGMTTLTNPANMENAPFCLDRWWIMETGGYAQVPLADMQFHYRESEWNGGTNAIVEDALILQDRFNGTWNYPPSVIASANNRFSSTARPFRNSEWTASSQMSTLPIELLTFDGQRISQAHVLLTWSTATERNNSGFEVWRMVEGEADFNYVGWVDGAGDSQVTQRYEMLDTNSSDDVSYYFLKQVDHDGTSTSSPMVVVEGSAVGNEITVYPNPARSQFSIHTSNTLRSVELLDGLGKVVEQWSPIQVYALDGIPAGVYLVRCLFNDGRSGSHRLVVE
jgi:hypothetical protein